MSHNLLKDHEVIDNKGDIYFHPKIIIAEFQDDLNSITFTSDIQKLREKWEKYLGKEKRVE